MSSLPPEPPGPELPPIPAGYKPGDYIPFADRDPDNPVSIAGTWADPARQAQMGGSGARPMTEEERYRAIYGADAPYRVTLASWGRRVLGHLIDSFFGLVASIPLIAGYVMLLGELDVQTDPVTGQTTTAGSDVSGATVGILVLGGLIALAFGIYNTIIRQGSTGYSLGKAAVGIRLVKESTNQPMGAGLCFVRQLAHVIDNLVCYLGWLWPLWDAKNQTLADKVMGTVVVIQDPDRAA